MYIVNIDTYTDAQLDNCIKLKNYADKYLETQKDDVIYSY